jgi:Restriction endonuclease
MPFKDPERQRAYFRARYLSKRAEISARKKLAYKANPDPSKLRSKKYKSENRELYLASSNRYRAAYYPLHRDKYAAYSKSYRETNRIRLATIAAVYRAEHKREHAEHEGRRRARKKNTAFEKVDFVKILHDSNGLCGICQQPFDLFGIDFDHIIPLARGGTHSNGNIQATHSRCNRAKGVKVG